MAATLRQVGDYTIERGHLVPGNPIAAYTDAAKGHLVIRDATEDNGFDRCADTEVPVGIVWTVNGTEFPLGIAEFRPGTTIILPTSGAIALNDKVVADGTALADVGTAGFRRGVVKAAGGGVGSVIDLEPFGANTATVRF